MFHLFVTLSFHLFSPSSSLCLFSSFPFVVYEVKAYKRFLILRESCGKQIYGYYSTKVFTVRADTIADRRNIQIVSTLEIITGYPYRGN